MPNIREMMGSKFLKQEDVAQPMLVTITHLDQQEVSAGDNKKEVKWCMHFAELDKPLVMNPTNLQLCAMALGSEETESWFGKKVVLFRDPNVSMGGKIVGGLRIRARRDAPQPAPQPANAFQKAMANMQQHGKPLPPSVPIEGTPFADMADDIPF